MKLDKTLDNLKRLHENFSQEVALLSQKKERVSLALQEATERMLQTFEAIQVLEGKPTLTSLLTPAQGTPIGTTGQFAEATPLPPAVAPTPSPDGLPPAEIGMKWAKNEAGEDVLVPINPPKALVTPESFVLPMPAVEAYDDFTDPRSLMV